MTVRRDGEEQVGTKAANVPRAARVQARCGPEARGREDVHDVAVVEGAGNENRSSDT